MARNSSKELVDVCRKKRENSEYIFFSSDTEGQTLEELLFGQGLFEKKYIVFCDEILGDQRAKHLIDNPEMYKESSHMFVVFEPDLDPKQEKKFSKLGAVMKKHDSVGKTEDTRALFLFSDIFVKGNKSKTLVIVHRLLSDGHNPDSILNILLWKLRTLVLVSNSKNISDTGLKPFVYSKAKEALNTLNDPFEAFMGAEEMIRLGRLSGSTDEEILERIVLNY